MNIKFRLTHGCLSILILLSAHTYALEDVSVQLRWYHQFQFAGYYMALEKGFYQQQGINPILKPGGPHALNPVDLVLSGNVDFAITSSGVVIRRIEGDPIVVVAAIMQTSPLAWITLSSSQIVTAQDLTGHTVMSMPEPESAELLSILKQEGINTETINIIPTSYHIKDLINGVTQAYNGYLSNEPYLLKQRGIKYNLIKSRDYGINFYSDVLVTSEALAKTNSDLIERFRKASLQGWKYALSNIDETVKLIHEKYAPNKTLEHLYFEANAIRDLVIPELIQIGHMNPARWEYIAQTYQNLDMVEGPIKLDGFIFKHQSKVNYSLTIAIASILLLLLGVAFYIILRFKKLSLALRRTNQELASIAISDPLTGIMNRRGFMENAERLISLEGRQKKKICMMVLDIDYFKRVNDTYGHPIGDFCLIEFTEIIQSCCRLHDLVSRIGGEEFIILLSDCDLQQIREKAQYIIKRVSEHEFKPSSIDKPIKLTVSIGISEVKGGIVQAWQQADEALYTVKNSGRNGLQIYMHEN